MRRLKVVILDMQPISPAVGGGRQRLLGLYHGLGPAIEAVYVGTYDWPGEAFRDQQLTPTLREICVPLSDAHHKAARDTAALMDGRGMIDVEFPQQVHLSPDYLSAARREMAKADVVIFSHPWCFPPLAVDLKPNQLVVYDAHNVESVLRISLHDDLPQANSLMELVVATEAELLERSNLVYCCSAEEVTLFHRIFEVPISKLRIAPNGTFTAQFSTGLLELRAKARKSSRERVHPVVVFMGSQYGPNAEAGRFIVDELAPHVPDATFLLVGGVGDAMLAATLPKNVVCTGIVDDAAKWQHLLAADFAINPMFSGAGTNVKMFDFLAAGLPVLTTAVGARGISGQSSEHGELIVAERSSLLAELKKLVKHEIGPERRLASYQFVQRRFSWEVISRTLGDELRWHVEARNSRNVPVLMFSTWGVACGIAEHGQYLAAALREQGADVLIFGNELNGHEPLGVGPELKFPVVRGWNWDNKNWRESQANLPAYEATLDAFKPRLVILQHHTGFMSVGEYHRLAEASFRRGIPVIIECHDAARLEPGEVALLCETAATVTVHSTREAERFGETANVVVLPLPIKIHPKEELADKNAGAKAGPVIGGFGFFREYKGIDITLEAVRLMRRHYPGLRYKGWHAIYPGEENSKFVVKCLELARQPDLREAVSLETSFSEIDSVIDGLSHCDLVVLPYADSHEGASASANMALAAGVPLVISTSDIFSSLKHVAQVVPQRTAKGFAEAMEELLGDDAKRLRLTKLAREWCEANSYLSMAHRLLERINKGQPSPMPDSSH